MPNKVPFDNDGVFTHSPLERLPRDLIWKILKITPESILELRLVSRQLKSCVDELALMRGIIQLEGPLIIGSQYRQPARHKSPVHSLEIVISVHRAMVKLTKLRIFLFNPLTNQESFDFDHHVAININVSIDDHRMIECLRDGLGRRLEEVHVRCSAKHSLEAVEKILEGVHSGHLRVMTSTVTEDVINFIQNAKANELHLSMSEVLTRDPVEVLLGLSSRFESITIHQLPIPGMALVEEYFFGLHDIEWAPVILDMFSGKMNSLRIINHYGWFLSSSCVEFLIESLPTLGKHVRFESSYKRGSNEEGYMTNQYFVQVKADTLKITHSSRQND